jgi:hypothetical protein
MLCFGVSTQTAYAGGPWTPGQKKGLFISNFTPNIYSRISTFNGDTALNRLTYDMTWGFYGEYGIAEDFAIIGYVPLKIVGTTNNVKAGDFDRTLDKGGIFSIGNTEWAFKYTFFKKGPHMAASMRIHTPIFNFDTATGLRTGYEAMAIGPFFHIGEGFLGGKMYAQLEGGYLYRTDDYSDEWYLSLEIGGNIKQKVWLALLIQSRQSLLNGGFVNPENNYQTGLYLNNEEYIAYSLKASYTINPKWGINLGIGGAVPGATVYIAATPAVTLGVAYNFDFNPIEERMPEPADE